MRGRLASQDAPVQAATVLRISAWSASGSVRYTSAASWRRACWSASAEAATEAATEAVGAVAMRWAAMAAAAACQYAWWPVRPSSM